LLLFSSVEKENLEKIEEDDEDDDEDDAYRQHDEDHDDGEVVQGATDYHGLDSGAQGYIA
jgi:hypothetical protein